MNTTNKRKMIDTRHTNNKQQYYITPFLLKLFCLDLMGKFIRILDKFCCRHENRTAIGCHTKAYLSHRQKNLLDNSNYFSVQFHWHCITRFHAYCCKSDTEVKHVLYLWLQSCTDKYQKVYQQNHNDLCRYPGSLDPVLVEKDDGDP